MYLLVHCLQATCATRQLPDTLDMVDHCYLQKLGVEIGRDRAVGAMGEGHALRPSDSSSGKDDARTHCRVSSMAGEIPFDCRIALVLHEDESIMPRTSRVEFPFGMDFDHKYFHLPSSFGSFSPSPTPWTL